MIWGFNDSAFANLHKIKKVFYTQQKDEETSRHNKAWTTQWLLPTWTWFQDRKTQLEEIPQKLKVTQIQIQDQSPILC